MINAAKTTNKISSQAIENNEFLKKSGFVMQAANVVPFPGNDFKKGQKSQLVYSWKDVYQQDLIRHRNGKWMMVINASRTQLKALSILKNTSNLLAVNPEKNIEFTTLINTLKRGNCSTLIITNRQFTEQQLRLLSMTSEQHDCRCIVIEEEMSLMAIAH